MCVYLAAVFVLSPGLSGLCLLEERVLLLSPCQEEMKRVWTRRCLPLLCRPALGFRINARAWWVHVTHLIVSSAGPPLSAGVLAPPGGALSWNCKKRKIKLSCDFFAVTCAFAKMKMSHRQLPSSRLRCKHFSFELDPSSPQSAVTPPPPTPPLMHLSSRLPSDVALVMCPRRLLSSRPTSLFHCSILLSAPGLCPRLDSSLSLSLSICTSSGQNKKERRDYCKEETALWTNPNNLLNSLIINESSLDECIFLSSIFRQ